MKNSKMINPLLFILLIFITVIVLGLPPIFDFPPSNIPSTYNSPSDSPPLIIHRPIEILSDNDFYLYNLTGSGSIEDPYVISNYLIPSILIKDTTKNLFIQNCYFNGTSIGSKIINIYKVADSSIKISNNIFNGSVNTIGVDIMYSSQLEITNNTFYNVAYGISSMYQIIVKDNIFFKCKTPLIISDYSSIIEDNWVDNKKIGYFKNSSNLVLTEPIYGQLIITQCSKIFIENQKLFRIDIDNSTNVLIKDNEFNNQSFCSIMLELSNNITLFNNSCTDNDIYLINCNNLQVKNNTWKEFKMYGQTNGTFSMNKGKHLFGRHVFYTVFRQNNFSYHTYDGMKLFLSKFCTIYENYFHKNVENGLKLDHCTNISVHHNYFYFNNPHGISQASDNYINNTWFDTYTLEGNYWSDWIGSGPYIIDHCYGNITDPYPMLPP